MRYYCNEEGVRLLRKMSSIIKTAIDDINNSTDSVRGVANDNSDALGPHVNSLQEALDDIKTSVQRSTSPASDVATRLSNVADKYQSVIDDDPFGDSSSGGGKDYSGAVGAAGFVGAAAAASAAGSSAGMSSGQGAGAGMGSTGSLGASQNGMKPVAGATPRNLPKSQYGFSIDSNFEAVYDSPMEMDEYLYDKQGSANASFQGTCGLCSCANILRLAGVEYGEGDMINFAAANGFCENNIFDPDASGGTGAYDRQQILQHFGVQSSLVPVQVSSNGASTQVTDDIAKYVSEGRGVILSVHAGILDPAAYNVNGFGDDYHAVTVTSVKRNAYGDPVGFYICDSNQGTKYYSADTVRRSLTGNDMNVTDQIIR